MTIKWQPTRDNHFQVRCGVDEAGNRYQVSANLETVTVRTPDGFTGCGWTSQEALTSACANREVARTSWLEPITLNGPATLTAADLAYWLKRSSVLLGESVVIRTDQ